jgi:hypothetical protein
MQNIRVTGSEQRAGKRFPLDKRTELGAAHVTLGTNSKVVVAAAAAASASSRCGYSLYDLCRCQPIGRNPFLDTGVLTAFFAIGDFR